MPNDQCQQLFGNVNDGMICIDTDADTEVGENVGVCSGDSGGPLNVQEGPGQYMTVINHELHKMLEKIPKKQHHCHQVYKNDQKWVKKLKKHDPMNQKQPSFIMFKVGVASFVSSAGCESEIFPHVYARVTYYMDWISENTGIPIEP